MSHEIHIPPREPHVPIADLTTRVRVPGRPATFRAFTADEEDEAVRYAAEHHSTCLALPLPLPRPR